MQKDMVVEGNNEPGLLNKTVISKGLLNLILF